MIKKFCTKHGIEYTGDSCPKCGNPETNAEKPNKIEKNKRKHKPQARKRIDSDAEIDDKLKALIDKWNIKE